MIESALPTRNRLNLLLASLATSTLFSTSGFAISPKILAIDSEEIRVAISEQVDAIVETVKIALEQTPPELAADIVDRGIVLTGGGALLKNLDKLLREETSLPITITENPLLTVALGSGVALDSIEILKQVVIQ